MEIRWLERIVLVLIGMLLMVLLILSLAHIRDTAIIKMYTEGKIVCTTLADEFICKKVDNG